MKRPLLHNHLSVREKKNAAISACCEHPGLRRVERAVQHSLMLHHLVALQDLYRHYEWVCQKVLHVRVVIVRYSCLVP